MLKLRQWTSKKDTADSAAASGDVTATGPSSSPTASPAQSETSGFNKKKSKNKNNDAIDPSDDLSSSSSAAAASPAQRSQEDPELSDSLDPDTLLEQEIDKRKVGNQRINSAVEALWSNLSKKKPMPFDMSSSQLAAVLAQLKLEEQEELDHDTTGKSSSASSEKQPGIGPGRAAQALADLVPGSGSKDKDKPDKLMIPVNALGIALTSYSELLAASTGPDSASALSVLPSVSTTQALSTSLGLLGRAYLQIAQLQTAFAADIKSVCLTRLARSHVQLEAYAGARKRADAAKSRFENARSKAQKSKREKRELEDELRIASAAYDDAISELEMRAEAVLYTSEAEDLSAWTDYLHSHLDYLHQSVECLERVKDKWAHVDERVLNRGIRAGSLVSNLPSTTDQQQQLSPRQDRPRSRATSLASEGNRTVRARKTSSRPGTASSITAAVAAGAGRFGFPSSGSHKGRSDSQDLSSSNNKKSGRNTPAGVRDVDEEHSDSAVSDDDGEDDQKDTALGDKKRPDSRNSKTDRRRKSSGNGSRPTFNRSLSRLSIFGNKKEEGATALGANDGKESLDGDQASVQSPSIKEKAEERPPSAARGWSDTFKAKNWRRDKDRDTGGFANIGDGGPQPLPGAHVQRLDEDEQRRRADLLSGISIGIEDSAASRGRRVDEDGHDGAPQLPKRQVNRRELSTDSYDQGGTTDRGGTAHWTTFGLRDRGGLHSQGPSDFDDDGARFGHVGRGESSAHTDIFQDVNGVSSPLGHSPFPSDGLGGTGPGDGAGNHAGPEPRMLAFNPTGLSAFSAGEESISSPGAADDGARRSLGLLDPRRGSVAQYLNAQDTGLSLGGLTDPGSHTHEDDDHAAEEERAVLTSNGASSQTQRYRSGGVLSRIGSGGTGGVSAGVGRGGAPPPPPVPSSSTFLKNKPPPPPIPSRGPK
ncbi:hypothetical protein OC846_002144 [Tilletia horrida]|uniref:BAR domain-containing protein n=1 Tax=Tilletia horrida TaxID=155126 RepID=A0AAN6GSH5_9BASI|nr:hypothetical protein OC846_002144 [Tilletia horrida]KAK0570195.1 hypothetical protein OC861_000144 [Tilletia horrida]